MGSANLPRSAAACRSNFIARSQLTEGSIKNQEERLRFAVKVKNMDGHFGEIKSVFIDRAKSGKDTNRPELQKMLLAIRKREIDLVMVSELSRISRSIKDFSDIWELMKANGCGFYSNRENFDTTTAAGEMVLFTVANIAQFERRQISERVIANFGARAQRGLFNGGSIPFGFKRIPEKPGYLAVDGDAAEVVRNAFQAFVRERTLLATARWLNENGFRMKKEREGGGDRSRLGVFTTGNLGRMLRNRMYAGVRVYRQGKELKETQGTWPALVDESIFAEVNQVLTNNFRCNKDGMDGRYPYLLTGLVSCGICGDRLVGKSAHGRNEKIGYYEHGWSTRKASATPDLKRDCAPYRVLAKHLEPALWEEIRTLLLDDKIARSLLVHAEKAHSKDVATQEADRCRHTLRALDAQLDVLADRLTSLPVTISPSPIYRQMEKLEQKKMEAQNALSRLESGAVVRDAPVDFGNFDRFRASLRGWIDGVDTAQAKSFVIRNLVNTIVVHPMGFEIFFRVGETYIKSFLEKDAALKDGLAKRQKGGNRALEAAGSAEEKNVVAFGSNTCAIGVTDGA